MLKFLKETLLFTIILCSLTSLYAQNENTFRFKTIVIDPGHGGRPGATYGNIKEKDITLAVALNLGEKIKATYPDIKVIYTRTDDTDIELYKRSQIANDALADLFISIHANSATAASAAGTETFVMGYDKSSQNMEVAMKENQVVTYESDYKQKYEDFDPNSAESYILFSLMQYSYVSQSTIFASYIQDEFKVKTPMKNRGVKQGPFLVLWRAAMPSVLTEIGFLSNANDRKYITSKAGQEKIAQSLFNAFEKYKTHLESSTDLISDENKEETITTPEKIIKADIPQEEIKFKLQILTSDKKLTINRARFGKYLSRIEVFEEGGVYKYLVAGCENYKEALSLQIEVRKWKYKDAFIVAFEGARKISVPIAISKTKK